MSNNLIEFSPSAYQYPLLIKHLLHYPLTHSPEQEIVYRDLRRHTYRTFRERIGRLASGLSQIGVKQGDVVAVLDWDSDRYHECYFAVPMMGAVLQTVNLTLAPEQLVFVLNDAGPSTVLVNADFLPLVEKLADKLQTVRKFVLLHDGKERPTGGFNRSAQHLLILRGEEVCHGDITDLVHGSAEGRAVGAMEERAKCCGHLAGAAKEEQDRR